MQWGALRAQASRPPQQPPGLAGSCMLRPPRAPLAVPRCPHRPHGGRLSKPEALQQGSGGGGGEEMGRQGQPTGIGTGWGGGLQSAMLAAPLCTQGARPRSENRRSVSETAQTSSSDPVADNGELRSRTQRRTGAPVWPPTRS